MAKIRIELEAEIDLGDGSVSPLRRTLPLTGSVLLIGDLHEEGMIREEKKETLGMGGPGGNPSLLAVRPPRQSPPGFDEWYAAYPRKAERRVAEIAYANLRRFGATQEDLLQAAKNYADKCRLDQTEEKFIKLPGSFLHKERWRDYLAASPEHTMSGEERTAIRAKWESGEYSSELVMKLEQKYKVKII